MQGLIIIKIHVIKTKVITGFYDMKKIIGGKINKYIVTFLYRLDDILINNVTHKIQKTLNRVYHFQNRKTKVYTKTNTNILVINIKIVIMVKIFVEVLSITVITFFTFKYLYNETVNKSTTLKRVINFHSNFFNSWATLIPLIKDNFLVKIATL